MRVLAVRPLQHGVPTRELCATFTMNEVARTPVFCCHPVEGIPARLLEDAFGSRASVWIRMAGEPNTTLGCQHKVAPTHRLDGHPSRVPQHDCWVVAMWGPNGWKRGFPGELSQPRRLKTPGIMRILEDPEMSGFRLRAGWSPRTGQTRSSELPVVTGRRCGRHPRLDIARPS